MNIIRWSLFVIVFAAVGLSGLPAQAWHVADFGESGYLDITYQGQLRLARRDLGSGPEGTDPTWDLYFRRNRLSALGAINETFGYAIQMEYLGGRKIFPDFVNPEGTNAPYKADLLDYYLTATLSDALQFRIGKTKQVMTREIQEGCYDALSLDRSDYILGPFSRVRSDKTTRDEGITVLGNFYNGMYQYRAAIMQGNNFGDTKPGNAGYRYTARAHVSLFDPESGWGYKGSYLGKKRVLTFGAGVETEPNAVYDSGTSGYQSYNAYTFDGFYEQPTKFGTYTVSAAYLKTDFGGAGSRDVADATGPRGERNGYYWKAAYMFDKFQVYARYEKWSFASLNGVMGQVLTYIAEGVNYYIKGQDLRLTLDLSSNSYDRGDAKGFHTVTAQFQGRF